MTTLYLDCFAGIAGNMAVGALLDLGADPGRLARDLGRIPFPEGPLELIQEKRLKSGIMATFFNTRDQAEIDHERHSHDHSHGHDHGPEPAHEHTHCHDPASGQDDPHEHDHSHCHDHPHAHPHTPGHCHDGDQVRGMPEIRRLLEAADLGKGIMDRALACFEALADAESRVHGLPRDEVHFHEVGARDSIADLVGTAICLEDLGVTRVHVSPVHVGAGFVTCGHGRIPIPAPATALLLEGLPIFQLPGIIGELTTPTGAAILRGVGAVPGLPPDFVYQAVGHGAGSKEFGIPNVLRAMLSCSAKRASREQIVLLETNLDNVTGELLGYVAERLWEVGALDVTVIPVQMKKGRPGTILAVMCQPARADELETLLFAELPTLGIRRQRLERTVLEREAATIETCFGPAKGKRIVGADGRPREVVEYEEQRRIAREHGMPLRDVSGLAPAQASVSPEKRGKPSRQR